MADWSSPLLSKLRPARCSSTQDAVASPAAASPSGQRRELPLEQALARRLVLGGSTGSEAGTPARARPPALAPFTATAAGTSPSTPADMRLAHSGGGGSPTSPALPSTSFRQQLQQRGQQAPMQASAPRTGPSPLGRALLQQAAARGAAPRQQARVSAPPPAASLEEELGRLRLHRHHSAATPRSPRRTPRAAGPAPNPAAVLPSVRLAAAMPCMEVPSGVAELVVTAPPPTWQPMLPSSSVVGKARGAGLLAVQRGEQQQLPAAAAAASRALAAEEAPDSTAVAATVEAPDETERQQADLSVLRRQLQSMAPELALAQLGTARPAAAAAKLPAAEARPTSILTRQEVQAALARMAELRNAAEQLLQEAGGTSTSGDRMGVDFAALSIMAAPHRAGQPAAVVARQRSQAAAERQRRRGPSEATLARLARLKTLSAEGEQLVQRLGQPAAA